MISRTTTNALAGVLLLGLAACGQSRDAAVVTVAAPPDVSVTHVVLDLVIGAHTSSVTVPAADGAPLVLPKTVSLTYPSGLGTMLQVSVHGFSGANHVAEGSSSGTVVLHGVTMITVTLQPFTNGADGGAPPDMSGAPPDMSVIADLTPGG